MELQKISDIYCYRVRYSIVGTVEMLPLGFKYFKTNYYTEIIVCLYWKRGINSNPPWLHYLCLHFHAQMTIQLMIWMFISVIRFRLTIISKIVKHLGESGVM